MWLESARNLGVSDHDTLKIEVQANTNHIQEVDMEIKNFEKAVIQKMHEFNSASLRLE